MANEDICQVCGKETEDIRHISIDCFYDLTEVFGGWKETFVRGENGQFGKNIYTIRVCKGCRAVFIFDFLKPFIERGGLVRRQSLTDTNGNQEISLAEFERRQNAKH